MSRRNIEKLDPDDERNFNDETNTKAQHKKKVALALWLLAKKPSQYNPDGPYFRMKEIGKMVYGNPLISHHHPMSFLISQGYVESRVIPELRRNKEYRLTQKGIGYVTRARIHRQVNLRIAGWGEEMVKELDQEVDEILALKSKE